MDSPVFKEHALIYGRPPAAYQNSLLGLSHLGLTRCPRVGKIRCARDSGKVQPSCGNNAMRDVTMACIDTSATGRC
jgi:hypothetical protein